MAQQLLDHSPVASTRHQISQHLQAHIYLLAMEQEQVGAALEARRFVTQASRSCIHVL
jgi:hypothetical protein